MARTMVHAIATEDDRNRGGFWMDPGIDLLAAGLHLTAVAGRPMGDLWSWMRQRDLGVFEPLIGALAEAAPGRVDERATGIIAGQARQEAAGANRETSAYWTYVNRALAAYQTDEALAATARPPVDWAELFARRGTVYIAASGRDQAEAAPILAAFIDSAVQARYRLHAGQRSGPGSAPLLLALDEAANIAPLDDLPRIAAEGGGQGVTLLAVFQTIAQARVRYGAQADGFFSLFPTTMILPGVRDRDTVELVSRLFGEYLAHHMTSNYGSTSGQTSSTSSGMGESVMYRPIAPFDEVATGRDGQMIVLGQGVRPEYVRMLPYYDSSWTLWREWFEANYPVVRPAPPRPSAPPATWPPPGDGGGRRSTNTGRP
jgi:type IV secretory pathway TraG/TraD family ATPase VirD4